jgi:quercetin dioxygenase-like cupin family protein
MPVDLRPEGAALAQAKTFPLVKEAAFEAIRMVMHQGHELKQHQTDGPITIYCLAGHLTFSARDRTHDLKPGQWVFLLGGEPHSLVAVEDSSLLLTILFPQSPAERASAGSI